MHGCCVASIHSVPQIRPNLHQVMLQMCAFFPAVQPFQIFFFFCEPLYSLHFKNKNTPNSRMNQSCVNTLKHETQYCTCNTNVWCIAILMEVITLNMTVCSFITHQGDWTDNKDPASTEKIKLYALYERTAKLRTL